MMTLDIKAIAIQLGKATRTRNGWSCLCPAHDDHHPSLSLSLSEDGKLLAYCYVGCTFPDILAALRKRGLLEKGEFIQGKENYPSPPLPKSAERALKIWRETLPAEDSPVQTYLRNRGYEGMIPPTLMFHPPLFT